MKSQKDFGGNEIDFGFYVFCFACTLLIDCANKRFSRRAHHIAFYCSLFVTPKASIS